jgi:hypothetical protein
MVDCYKERDRFRLTDFADFISRDSKIVETADGRCVSIY